jgi:hypothetical protein
MAKNVGFFAVLGEKAAFGGLSRRVALRQVFV